MNGSRRRARRTRGVSWWSAATSGRPAGPTSTRGRSGSTVAMNLNTAVVLENAGVLTVAGSTTVNGTMDNSGLATFSGGLTVNGSGALQNTCALTAVGNLVNGSPDSSNDGLVVVTGDLVNNGEWQQTQRRGDQRRRADGRRVGLQGSVATGSPARRACRGASSVTRRRSRSGCRPSRPRVRSSTWRPAPSPTCSARRSTCLRRRSASVRRLLHPPTSRRRRPARRPCSRRDRLLRRHRAQQRAVGRDGRRRQRHAARGLRARSRVDDGHALREHPHVGAGHRRRRPGGHADVLGHRHGTGGVDAAQRRQRSTSSVTDPNAVQQRRVGRVEQGVDGGRDGATPAQRRADGRGPRARDDDAARSSSVA